MDSLLIGGGGWGDRLGQLDAAPFTDPHQGVAERTARLPGVARGEIGNRGLATARLFGDLALGDAFGGECGDVVFPLHELQYIGFPMF